MDIDQRGPWLCKRVHVLVVWGLLGLLTACGRDAAPEAQAPPRTVLTMTVGETPFQRQAVYAGSITARNLSNQGFRVSGMVVRRIVEVGDHVVTGQPLLQLDPANLELTRQQALAQLNAARSKAAQARVDLSRDATLLKQQYISQASYDRDKVALDTAVAELQAAQAQYGEASNELDYGTLRAAVDGIVTAINVDVGDVVNPGKTAVAIAHDGDREVDISVPESHVPQLRSAQSLSVTLWAMPGKSWSARLRAIDPAASKTTGTYDAHVTVLEPDAAMLLGMTAYVHLASSGSVPVFQVPLTAVVYPQGAAAVWKVNHDETVATQAVTLADVREDVAYVASGLTRGDVIVTVGGSLLHAGEKVSPRAAPQSRD